MEIFIKRSTIKRQSKTCEEVGLCHDSRFGGFDVHEKEQQIVCKHHCRLGCPYIHPMEGHRLHEYISGIDY